jgi:transcriptional regulator NrdR family protein
MKYKELKNRLIELEQDIETETLKNKKLNEALKNCLQNFKDSAQRGAELSEVKHMLIEENNKLKSFNESKTENISNLITDSIAKDKEIAHLRFMLNEMRHW